MYRISILPANLFERVGGIEEGFALLERAGIEGIQFALGALFMPYRDITRGAPSLMDQPLPELLTAMTPYRDAARRHHIAFTQVHAPYPSWVWDDEATNRRMLEVIGKSIAITGFLDSPHCVIHPAFSNENTKRHPPEEEWALNRAFYGGFIPLLKEYHVMALLENMFCRDFEGGRVAAACADPYEAALWVDRLNEMAGEECFGFCLDVGHMNLARQNPERALYVLGNRVKALHMHDNDGHLDQHRTPFTGTVDWELFLDTLKAVGYQGDLNFEAHHGVSDYPVALTEAAIRMQAEVGRYFKKRMME